MVSETHMTDVTDLDFSKNVFVLKMMKIGQKLCFFEWIENFRLLIFSILFYNESLYLLFSCTNSMFGKKLVPEIWPKSPPPPSQTRFLNQLYPEKIVEIAWFVVYWYKFMKIQSWLKSICVGMVKSQKWVWWLWSQDSKTDCISRFKWWNQQILCMLIQIHES